MCKKLNAEKESSTPAKEKKCHAFTFSRIVSLSLSYYKNTVIRCLSRSLAVIIYFVVSKMYVRNESNIRSYVFLSFL